MRLQSSATRHREVSSQGLLTFSLFRKHCVALVDFASPGNQSKSSEVAIVTECSKCKENENLRLSTLMEAADEKFGAISFPDTSVCLLNVFLVFRRTILLPSPQSDRQLQRVPSTESSPASALPSSSVLRRRAARRVAGTPSRTDSQAGPARTRTTAPRMAPAASS